MVSIITKIIWFAWSTFAPEKAKVELEAVFKDFIKIIAVLVTSSFFFGAGFFAGLYFLAQWLIHYIDFPIVCYLIGGTVSLFFTLVGILLLFRYVIVQFLKRAHDKGDAILNEFTFKK